MPELYIYMEWNEGQVSFYRNIIGVLIWTIKLGRVDISFEVSPLSIYLAFSRTGHLIQDLHIFKYLEKHNINNLAFGPCYQRVTSDQDIQSKVQAVKDLYVDAG